MAITSLSPRRPWTTKNANENTLLTENDVTIRLKTRTSATHTDSVPDALYSTLKYFVDVRVNLKKQALLEYIQLMGELPNYANGDYHEITQMIPLVNRRKKKDATAAKNNSKRKRKRVANAKPNKFPHKNLAVLVKIRVVDPITHKEISYNQQAILNGTFSNNEFFAQIGGNACNNLGNFKHHSTNSSSNNNNRTQQPNRCSSSSSSSGVEMVVDGRMKMQFNNVSYHFGNKPFAFKVSLYLQMAGKAQPLMELESSSFHVFARKPTTGDKRKKLSSTHLKTLSTPTPPSTLSTTTARKKRTRNPAQRVQAAKPKKQKNQQILPQPSPLIEVDEGQDPLAKFQELVGALSKQCSFLDTSQKKTALEVLSQFLVPMLRDDDDGYGDGSNTTGFKRLDELQPDRAAFFFDLDNRAQEEDAFDANLDLSTDSDSEVLSETDSSGAQQLIRMPLQSVDTFEPFNIYPQTPQKVDNFYPSCMEYFRS